MPELKRTFSGGAMNKDLDERLVPNGQYRDALNVQVSTSEGADVGADPGFGGDPDTEVKGGVRHEREERGVVPC